MSQIKTLGVGYRWYEVLTLSCTDTEQHTAFPSVKPEMLRIYNTGAQDALIKIGKAINDEIRVKAGTERDIPIKGVTIYYRAASGTTTIEVIGFSE